MMIYRRNTCFYTFFCAAVIVLLSGCSALQKTMEVSKPKALVTGVSVDSLSMEAVTLLVDVEVSNPNSFAIKTAGFDLDFLINDRKIASVAQADSNLTLPAKGKNSLQLPVTLTFDQVMKSVEGLSTNTEFNYAIDGNVVVNLPVLGDWNMPVSFSGVLPIPKQPEVVFKEVSVDAIGFSGVQLHVDLSITNPNVFEINLQDVSYALKAEGQSLGQGEIQSIDLPKGSTQTLSIPLSIGISDMGMNLYRLLTSSDPVAVDVNVGAKVDTDIAGWRSTPLQFKTQQVLSR
ncbi:LEA type 2 family protein [Marinomonas profundimaris]|uniref:Water stress and hypersensitive response domain-containing protein n=1 Tax=Marinomonas profundimaris TaxID=1208321 RepID=W1S3L7_9GAMM|nr:LEA type 2 family protein [Marinomonas profundimaris]ETI62604.1 hypothetical protein D104_01210 [Marinomonas profundimaris]